MNKTLLVSKREYLENLTTKTFWISIFILPIVLVLSIVIPILLERAKDARQYVVVDQSGWLLEAIEATSLESEFFLVLNIFLESAQKGTLEKLSLPESLLPLVPLLEKASIPLVVKYFSVSSDQSVPELSEDLAQKLVPYKKQFREWWGQLSRRDAKKISNRLSRINYQRIIPEQSSPEQLNLMIADQRLFAYFVITQDPLLSNEGFKYVCNNLTDDRLKMWFASFANRIVQSKRFEQEQIDPQLVQQIMMPLEFKEKMISENGLEEEVRTEDTIRQWIPMAFVYLLWIAVFTSAQMLLTNTIEEKSNRVIEVLLSSISASELMIGKIFGIAATGFTIVLSWVAFFFLALKLTPLLAGDEFSLDLSFIVADPIFLVSFLCYFMLGYLFYAALLVSMGAACNSLKEAQNLLGPVTIILIIPLFAMVPISQDPNGTLAKILSYIPPFTPFIMMNRVAGPPSMMEYILTTVLLIISILVAFWGAAKIFRVGILMTGKPPKLKEIFLWIRTS
ncbi:MAG: ABC transporter permease [Planctomycetota bacterium]